MDPQVFDLLVLQKHFREPFPPKPSELKHSLHGRCCIVVSFLQPQPGLVCAESASDVIGNSASTHMAGAGGGVTFRLASIRQH